MLLMPIIALPMVTYPAMLPKIALMVPCAAGGEILLFELARRRDTAARLALGFLGWAVVSAAFAPSPRLSFIASYGVDRGVVVLAGYLGCWAIGRRLSPAARPLLLAPTQPGPAPRIASGQAPVSSKEEAITRFFKRRSFTTPFNLAALPAIAADVRALRRQPPAGMRVDVATS